MVERCEDTPSAPSRGESVETKLHRIARKARREPEFRFTSLFHLMDMELLRGCFGRLRGDAAAGIDGVTKREYAKNLEENLGDLIARLHRMAYIPQDVRRVYIPKPGSAKGRPLGIPALEDKLVGAAMGRILEQVYEQDFIDDSYGFRPGRGCHDALCALSQTVETGKIHWIVEADIKGFFDHVSHGWLAKFLAHRIGDRRVQRYVKRFLKAGVMEEGERLVSDEGVPQGGSISPILANVYLHYTLDLWYERRFKSSCLGQTRLIRYADDFVVCFASKAEAERFRVELVERLGKFGLEVEPSKTKVIAFGPGADRLAREEGRAKADTFDFLGFTHYCSRSRNGKRFRMKRRTSRKKFRQKLSAYKEWLKANRAKMRNAEIWERTRAMLRGHYAYYGVTDNSRSLANYAHQVKRLLFKWLNRQGGKRRMNWEKFTLMERRSPFPQPRITVNLLPKW
jgi:RNA-directed DNA polymerase